MERKGEEDQDKDGWTHSRVKGYSSGATISNLRRDARDRAGWRGAATAVARGRMRLDGTRSRRYSYSVIALQENIHSLRLSVTDTDTVTVIRHSHRECDVTYTVNVTDTETDSVSHRV